MAILLVALTSSIASAQLANPQTNGITLLGNPAPLSNQVPFTLWMNTGVSPYATLTLFDGTQNVPIGTLNTATHTWVANGGITQLSVSGVTSNAQLGSVSLPANAFILYALVRETAGHAVNLAIGSTSGGSDVMSAITVPASGTIEATTASFSKLWFSATAAQAFWLSSASWNGASVNIFIVFQVGP